MARSRKIHRSGAKAETKGGVWPKGQSSPVSILTWNRLSRSLEVLGQTSRILLAPFQRLPDDFVFVRAREMPQEPLARSLVDKRGKRRPLRAPPCVQVDRIPTMIDALLKRCRVPHCSPDRHTLHPRNELAIAGWGIFPASSIRALQYKRPVPPARPLRP